MSIPWVVLLAGLVGAYYWHRKKSLKRGFGAGLATWAIFGLIASALIFVGISFLFTTPEADLGIAYGFSLGLLAMFGAAFWIGWRWFKGKKLW
jgi:hypothetical protein